MQWRKGPDVGQLIMLGTLFGLIIVIFGVVMYFDPQARGGASEDREP
jgi:hypothetical protein